MANPGEQYNEQQNSSNATKPISQLLTASDLQKRFDHDKAQRSRHENQWKENLAFYKGRQYTFFSNRTRRLETLPTSDGEKSPHVIRIVSNQISPGLQSWAARVLKTKPRMMATPGSGSYSDLQAAQMSERLLEFWWDDFELDDALEEALLWGGVCGQGFLKVCWDDHAGKQMEFTIGPDGNPIIDDSLKEKFAAELSQMGLQPQKQVVYMGDISVEVISPFNLIIDSSASKFSEAKYAFEIAYMGPDELATRYGVTNAKADSVSGPADRALPLGPQDELPSNVTKVVTGYFLPTPAVPRGRIVTWINGRILDDQPWYYPTNELPFVKIPGLRIPGELYDSSLVEQAIPLQKELNRTISQIVQFKNLTVTPQWTAPFGSIREQRSNVPGAIWQYNPIGPAGLKPEPVDIGTLPAYVFTHLENIQQRMDDIFGNRPVTEGQVGPNVEAGIAIDLLQEMATDRDAPYIRLVEMGIAKLGRLMLSLAKRYYIEPRTMRIRGSGGAQQVKSFYNADIDGAVDVLVESGSALPRTRAGRQARILDFIDRGLIPEDQAYKYLDMADLKALSQKFATDEEQAYREHEKLNVGEPISGVAMAQAQQQIQQAAQQGIDPQTGQPFQSPDELQMFAQQTMMQASVQANQFDNHSVHIDIHTAFMHSYEYEQLDVETQQRYEDHVNSHYQILMSLPNPAMSDNLKINLQLKSTIGPHAQGEILQKFGIPLQEQDMLEQPMETWVSDSVDKPDADGGGPGEDGGVNLAKVAQINAQAKAQATSQAQATHASGVKAEVDVMQAAQQHQHAEERHRAEMQLLKAKIANERKRKTGAKPTGGK